MTNKKITALERVIADRGATPNEKANAKALIERIINKPGKSFAELEASAEQYDMLKRQLQQSNADRKAFRKQYAIKLRAMTDAEVRAAAQADKASSDLRYYCSRKEHHARHKKRLRRMTDTELQVYLDKHPNDGEASNIRWQRKQRIRGFNP